MTAARVVVALLVATLLSGCFGPFAAEPGLRFEAVFARTNNLFEGSDVRILGVPKGKVVELRPEGSDVSAVIEMNPGVELPADVVAEIKPVSMLGERFIQLDPPYTGGPLLQDGDVIGKDRTIVAVDIDEVLAGFERFLEGMDEETLAELVDVLTETLEGQGEGLNQLLGQGAETVRVLRRSSDDLNGAVAELADLNTTVATRDEELGALFDDLSAVMRTIADESPQIIEGMQHLRRLTAELRPLTDRHSDALVEDLEILATSVSTVERNLERVGEVLRGSNQLFDGAGRAFDYENARLKLDNEAENIPAIVGDRLVVRLAGVCIRLGIDECSDSEFFEPLLPIINCIPEVQDCEVDPQTFEEMVLAGLNMLPPDARAELSDEMRRERRRQQQQDRTADDSDESAEPEAQSTPPVERMPLPDPRLEEPASTQDQSLIDRLSRWLGGA